MEALSKITELEIRDLTSEKILGLQQLKKTEYSNYERAGIKKVLLEFALCKNENYSEPVIETWINEFQELQINSFEAVKRIRLAKHEKKFGVTEFAIFMNVNLNDYKDFYEHEKKEDENIPEAKGFGKAIPMFNHFRDLKKPEYLIIDELKPDKDCEYGYILIKDDRNYSVFYSKEHFKLIQ